jgi:hypothetical protein
MLIGGSQKDRLHYEDLDVGEKIRRVKMDLRKVGWAGMG